MQNSLNPDTQVIDSFFQNLGSSIKTKVYTRNNQEIAILYSTADSGDVCVSQLYAEPIGTCLSNYIYEDSATNHIDWLLDYSEDIVKNILEKPDDISRWGFLYNFVLSITSAKGIQPLFFPLVELITKCYHTKMTDATGALLRSDFLVEQAHLYKDLYFRIRNLVQTYLDVDTLGSDTPYLHYQSNPEPVLQFGTLTFESIPNYPAESYLGDVLYPNTPNDIVNYVFSRCIISNIELKRCEYCKQYFVYPSRGNAKYCHRVYRNTGKTCKQLAFTSTREKVKENPIEKEYERAYKMYYARMLSGRMTKEEFKRWADHARQLRKDCYEDKISAETFIKLMKNP